MIHATATDAEPATATTGWRLLTKCLLIFAALLALACVGGWLDGGKTVVPAALFAGAREPWLNAMPSLLLLLALLALTRRLLLSTWLALLLQAMVYGVSALKFANLAGVLSIHDFALIGQVGGDSSLFWRYLDWSGPLPFWLLTALVTGMGLARFEPPLLARQPLARGALLLAASAAFASLIAGYTPWQQLYAKDRVDFRPWESANATARKLGLISTLAMDQLYKPSSDASANDPQAAKALQAAHADAIRAWLSQAPSGPLPDIVIIQSESFFDPARLRGLEPAASIPHFRQLAARGQSGELRVPTFGGGTIRTEFEVLTGLPLSSFPGLQYPYLGIESAHLRGLVSSLKHAGYRSTAVHPNKGGFWNRRNVFRQLGFDRFISEDDPAFAKAPRRGYYISDAAFTDVVLSSLAADGPPQFVFGISIEEHGPYDNVPLSADAAAARNAIPVPAGLDPASTQRLQTYLLHQRDADAQLGRLASALAQRARPSLLLFYGDHLPGLGDVYQLGFDDGRDASEQPVPYLLIEPGQPHAPTRRDLPAWMLGSTILDRAGVRNDPWFALLAAVQPALEPQHGHLDDALAHQLAAASALRLRGQ